MIYHITYTDRLTGKTEVGRVSISSNVWVPTAKERQRAIQAAYWKFPTAKRSSISAVRVSR